MINIKLIDAVIERSHDELDENDARRLAFFREIWQVLSDQAASYESVQTVNQTDLEIALKQTTPYISKYAAPVSRERYLETLEKLTTVILNNEHSGDTLIKALDGLSWSNALSALEDKDFVLAGTDLEGFIALLQNRADLVDEALMVAALALRPSLEKVADAVKPVYESLNIKANHPVACPVCGARASVARVGKTKRSQGRGKELYCQTCGFTWEFERVRCAVCGMRDQQKLHYFNLEGDDAHRIAQCDECGEYTRTVYQDEELGFFSFEVEDVLLAKLDEVAKTFRE